MNSTNTLADRLNSSIDQFVSGQRSNAVETHDFNSLCKRLLAPPDVVENLLRAGVLRAESPVHANDPDGLQAWNSDHLNEVRRAILEAITAQVIEESDGDPDEIPIAAGRALRQHVASFDKAKGKTEFARFPAGIVQLSRGFDGRFGTQQEQEPGVIERAANAGAKVAAVGAAGYAGASYLRGYSLVPGGSVFEKLRAGSRANIATGRSVIGKIGQGAQRVADVLKPKIRIPAQ